MLATVTVTCRKYVCAVRLLQRHAGQIHLYDEDMPETDGDAVVRPAGLTLYGPRYGPIIHSAIRHNSREYHFGCRGWRRRSRYQHPVP